MNELLLTNYVKNQVNKMVAMGIYTPPPNIGGIYMPWIGGECMTSK